MSFVSPDNTEPCKAAPIDTASSGFTSLRNSLPKKALRVSCTKGIRVCPPTNTTSSMSETDTPASFNAVLTGSNVALIKGSTNCSNLARVIFRVKCLGPDASIVIYGRFTSVCIALDSSILAFSAASLTRCIAITSCLISKPDSFLNSSQM